MYTIYSPEKKTPVALCKNLEVKEGTAPILQYLYCRQNEQEDTDKSEVFCWLDGLSSTFYHLFLLRNSHARKLK